MTTRTCALSLCLSLAALSLGVAGCDVGARTGLTIPEYDAGRRMDGGPDAPDAPPVCMPGEFPLVPATADVVFTIDRSGSMRLTIDGIEDAPEELWRWRIMRDALAGAFDALDPRVNVGAKFYPDPLDPLAPPPPPEESCRSSLGIDVPVSAGGRAAIIDIFNSTEALGGTPTAPALASSSAALRVSTSPRRFIVLATDGGPNCNGTIPRPCVCTAATPTDCEADTGEFSCLDDARTLEVIDQTFRVAGIPVFVVGIEDPMRPDLADVMDRMAVAGGRPRDATARRRFYSVRTAAELGEALDVIVSSISQCGFVSPSVPVDESTFTLTLDGVEIPRSEVEGWAWTDRAIGEVQLFGSWCDRATRPGSSVVAIIDDCP